MKEIGEFREFGELKVYYRLIKKSNVENQTTIVNYFK